MQVKSIVRKFLNKQIVIIGSFILFVCIACPAQNTLPENPSFGELKSWLIPGNKFLNQARRQTFALAVQPTPRGLFSANEQENIYLPLIQIRQEQAFFCRMEYQLSLKTNLPFKFRLGSVEYVDWLEKKPGCSSF